MAKGTSKTSPVVMGGLAIGLFILVVILWLSNNKKKKMIVEKNNENDSLQKSLIDLDNQRNYWQNSFYSQQTWLQQFQYIPHPKESIKHIISQLEKLKSEAFNEKTDFVLELDASIHALKGEKLQTSFGILTKRIENLLEDSFIENEEFCEQFKKKLQKGREHLNMGNFIDFAIQKGYFEGEDGEFLREIKRLRNDFIHEISPEIDENILIGLHLKIVDTISFVVFETWSQ